MFSCFGGFLPPSPQAGGKSRNREHERREGSRRPERAARTSDTGGFVARAVLEEAGGVLLFARRDATLSQRRGKEQARIEEKPSAHQHTCEKIEAILEKKGDANLRRESSGKSSCTHFRHLRRNRRDGGESEPASRSGFQVGELKE
jgi:hypothetical protein